MKAMILAAGRGERMRPLTDTLPKPLLLLAGRPLIEYPLRALVASGVRDVVINLGYRGAQIREHLGDGGRFGACIAYSEEGDPPLETGGGLLRALPLLGGAPFLVANADVYCEYPWSRLVHRLATFPEDELAHLVLVPNPPQHPTGDFGLDRGRLIDGPARDGRRHTYSGLSILHPRLFEGLGARPPSRFPLAPLLRAAAAGGQAGAELFAGHWSDIGTPQRLAECAAALVCQHRFSGDP